MQGIVHISSHINASTSREDSSTNSGIFIGLISFPYSPSHPVRTPADARHNFKRYENLFDPGPRSKHIQAKIQKPFWIQKYPPYQKIPKSKIQQALFFTSATTHNIQSTTHIQPTTDPQSTMMVAIRLPYHRPPIPGKKL